MREDHSENREGGRTINMREDRNKNNEECLGLCLMGEREKCSQGFLKDKKEGSYFLLLPNEEQ